MDISSQIIAELRAEIVDLKKRVCTLEQKFNNKEDEMKDVNLNGCIDLQDVSKVSLFCVFEPNASSNHEDACQNVHEPQDSPNFSPVCVSVCSDAEQRSKSSSSSYPQISSVCSVFKKEPDPMEIPNATGLGGVEHIALREMNDVNTMTPRRESKLPHGVPLNLDCHEELQTPLKNCSVQLVDCGNTLKQVKKRAKASKKSFTAKCRQSSRIKKSKRLKHPLDCSLCIKTMSTASSLQNNKSDHTTEKIYQCSQCERKFSYFQNYIKHKKLHARKQLRQNQDKKINEKKQLRQNRDKKINKKKQVHQNVDKNGDTDMQIMEMGYPCTLCGKIHTYLRLTKGHMTVHSGEKLYECNYCGLRFTYPQNHKNHLKKHTGEKPYECTYCGTQFTLDLCLNEHVKLHTG